MKKEHKCPVCNGTCEVPYTGSNPKYVSGYNPENKSVPCSNCGGQYQFGGGATGLVVLNKHENPCIHKYVGISRGRCYVVYTCTECGDSHGIDSGD